MRISVASVPVLENAETPLDIYFTVKFIHPCHFAVFHDNGGLNSQLEDAVTGGISDSTTIAAYPYSFPTLPGEAFDCGTQTVTIVEPAPAYSSGPVSNFITISAFNEGINGFEITVTSTDLEEGEIGTFSMDFYV